MIRHRSSTDRRPGLRSLGSSLSRAGAATLVATLPLLFSGHSAAAQDAPTPPAAGVPAEVTAKALTSLGVVTIGNDHAIGWVAAPGLVVTSDVVADEVGKSATFAVANSKDPSSCYVASRDPAHRLSILRCLALTGAVLGIETKYPEPGTPVVVAALDDGSVTTLLTENTTVVANDVDFMSSNRLRLASMVTPALQPGAGILTLDNYVGAPVINADGRVVSTLLTAPDDGGLPIGNIPADLTKAVSKALPLPASFRTAAIIAVGRRAVIPALIGLVAGIIWALVARSGGLVTKALGLTAVGIVGAVVYSLFTVMVVGPQTLLG